MLEYTTTVTKTGLVAQLRKEVGEPVRGDVEALDRLTLVLRKLGRYSELVEPVDAYFEQFPDSEWPSHVVFWRRAEAAAILAGERKAPTPKATKPRLLMSGTMPEAILAPLLEKARRGRYPYEWMVIAKLCRAHRDHDREITLMEEYLTLWNTVYLDRAVRHLRGSGIDVPDVLLSHVAPLSWEHIGLTGDYLWSEIDKPRERFRPLRLHQQRQDA
jgi:hypothetical protein